MVKEIAENIKNMQSNNFMEFMGFIKGINPIRYENIDVMYLQNFVSACGAPLIFALENPGYLFLLVTSSMYKTQITSFNLNKIVGPVSKKILTQLQGI
jgi:hypothetical protein